MTTKRNFSTSFRRHIEARHEENVDLCFLTIENPELVEPVRVVWDNKDFIKGGKTFIGFPFDIVPILTDDDQPPRAQLKIQNIDPRIGDALQNLSTALRLTIELASSIDWNLDVDPRTEKNSSTTEIAYTATNLFLINVKVDAVEVAGEIVGWDYLQRTWPAQRVTQDLLPGAFR